VSYIAFPHHTTPPSPFSTTTTTEREKVQKRKEKGKEEQGRAIEDRRWEFEAGERGRDG